MFNIGRGMIPAIMRQATSEQEIFGWHELEKLVHPTITTLRLDDGGIGSSRIMPYKTSHPAINHRVERDIAGRAIRCTLETKANAQSEFVVESDVRFELMSDEENRLWLSDGSQYLTVEQVASYIMQPFLG
jgi:hypothetical protein